MICNVCGSEIPDNVEFCPQCGAKIVDPVKEAAKEAAAKEAAAKAASDMQNMQSIPLEEAAQEFDPEDGTTVLTEGMSGPLVGDQFAKKPREHQPQSPEGKVVTPAPVTGSSILSDDSVIPAGNVQPQQATAPKGAQGMPNNAPKGAPQQMQQPQGVMQQQMPKPQFAPQPQGAPQQQIPRPMTPPVQGASPTVSALGYFGYMLLFSLPIIGLIFAIIFAISHKNKNVKSFSRGWLLMLVFVIVLNVILYFVLRAMGIEYMEDMLENILGDI
ncbi:MAG: zinc-ribbon domain-containing protein [Eubacterium sp.]|nr:zinc-ribbon domain-containing protein [Eubacterium sp.]